MRYEIEYRIHYIARDLGLTDAEKRELAEYIFILDLGATPDRLVQADSGGNLYVTDLPERIVRSYGAEGLSRQVDQYAGRSGSAGADNARFVWVTVAHSTDDEATYRHPKDASPDAMARGGLFRLHIPKLSGAPPINAPIWFERDGFRFTHLTGAAPTAAEKEAADIARLKEFLAAELSNGVKHTPNTLEVSLRSLRMSARNCAERLSLPNSSAMWSLLRCRMSSVGGVAPSICFLLHRIGTSGGLRRIREKRCCQTRPIQPAVLFRGP
jgi:hypothetical protein